MITVEDLYREDVSGKIISVGCGKELRGPCPGCGGTDRFGVYTHQNNGRGSFFCGRYKGRANTGCAKGGDAIQYLRDFRGMSYVDACGYLGIEPKNVKGQSHYRYSTPKIRSRKYEEHTFVPDEKKYPAEVVDPAKWREHALKFVDACHAELMKRNVVIAYLMGRGISREVIAKYRLGYHPGQVTRGKPGQPSYRPWPSWGLRDEKIGSRIRKIALPAGIVIPYFVDDLLYRITIRRDKPDERTGKYHYVKGSRRDLWFTNPDARYFVTVEAELDCLAIISAVGDEVGTVGIGTTGAKPDKRIHDRLARSVCILGSMDFDKPRKNPKTGRTEMPGGFASAWWKKTYPQHKRWPVPIGKDPGEAFEKGLDLREWIMAGLPKQQKQQTPKMKKPINLNEKSTDKEEVQSCVVEVKLSNGEIIYLVKFDKYGRLTEEGLKAWRELTSQKKPVFTEREMEHLHNATQLMKPEEKLEAGMLLIDIKKTFGGVVKASRLLNTPDEVKGLVKIDRANQQGETA